MNEPIKFDTLRHYLDSGLHAIPENTCVRLAAARQKALQHHHRHQEALTWLGWPRPALVTLLLALSLGLASLYLHTPDEISELAVLDSDLLIDDLPPKAFTDPGFRIWLEESPES